MLTAQNNLQTMNTIISQPYAYDIVHVAVYSNTPVYRNMYYTHNALSYNECYLVINYLTSFYYWPTQIYIHFYTRITN